MLQNATQTGLPDTADAMMPASVAKFGLLWRQNPSADGECARLHPIFASLAELGIETVPVLYADEALNGAREQLLHLDGALVWVDPIAYGQDRAQLDALLREVAARGVWVSAHSDMILKMGTKEVLFTTRQLGWGTDTDLYLDVGAFRERLPRRLATSGARVLKQYRGNGGQGVWKVGLRKSSRDAKLGEAASPLGPETPVRILEARRNSLEQDTTLGEFMDRCAAYFSGAGWLLDQPFQARLPEGMIRCYLSQDTVIGFAHQLIRGLMPAPADSDPTTLPQTGPRIMQHPSAPGFEMLRQKMEAEWVPAMCRVLDWTEPCCRHSGMQISSSAPRRPSVKTPTCCVKSTRAASRPSQSLQQGKSLRMY